MSNQRAQHTPGPWRVDASCGGLAIESVSHGSIGIVNLARASKADARLIAAAPDLLALAIQYADECSECHGKGYLETRTHDPQDSTEYPCPACEDIRAVIDRAEGLV